MDWIINIFIVLLGGLMFRIRGGLCMPFTDKEFPFNKLWWGAWICFMSWWVFGLNWHWQLTAFVAGMLSVQWCGWGRCKGAIFYNVINWADKDSLDINYIIDNLHVTFKGHTVWLKDYPRAYGVVGMSLRGGLLTCLIGLCFHSVLLMGIGLTFGLVDLSAYYFNKLIDDKAGGWNWSEFFEGMIITGGILCLKSIFGVGW